MGKKRQKIVKGKVENWEWKDLFCLSLSETTDICLESTKMEISTGKSIHAGKKKSLDMDPIVVKQILKRGSHFTKTVKTCKISHFRGRETPLWSNKFLKEGPISQKLWKLIKSVIFEVEKPHKNHGPHLQKQKEKKPQILREKNL